MISVIVCAYNEEYNIEDCLHSLCNQKFNTSYQIVVMDNSSTDKTKEIAVNFFNTHKFKNIQSSVVSIDHVCLSVSRNTAVRYVKGDVVLYVDADTVSDCYLLSEISSSFSEGVGVVYGRVLNKNQSAISKFMYKYLIGSSYVDNKSGGAFIGACMAIKTKVFESGLWFRPRLIRGDDTCFLREYKATQIDRVVFNNNAIVHNDFPSSLSEWVKNVYREGVAYSVIDKNNDLKFLKKMLLKSGMITMLIGSLACIYLFLLMLLGYGLRVSFPYIKENNRPQLNYFLNYLLINSIALVIRDFGYVFGGGGGNHMKDKGACE